MIGIFVVCLEGGNWRRKCMIYEFTWWYPSATFCCGSFLQTNINLQKFQPFFEDVSHRYNKYFCSTIHSKYEMKKKNKNWKGNDKRRVLQSCYLIICLSFFFIYIDFVYLLLIRIHRHWVRWFRVQIHPINRIKIKIV